MNQIRCGGSLGVSQVSEARKNIRKGSGKAGHGAMGTVSDSRWREWEGQAMRDERTVET